MERITLTQGNRVFERVSKTTAKKLFGKGIDVYALPCKCNPNSPWYKGFVNHPISHIDNTCCERDFNTWYNMYSYYNCNKETGKYISFYVCV